MKQEIRVERQAPRTTVHRNALPQAVGSVADVGGGREIESQVVGDEEIDATVAIVVDERATRSPSRAPGRQPGARGHVLEPAVAAVSIENVLPVVGDEDVQPAVVVVVAGTDARCPPDIVSSGSPFPPVHQTGARRHITERAVVIIPVQPGQRRFPRRIRFGFARPRLQPRPVQNERIHPAVVVVVEERDAGAVGLDDEALAIDVAIDRRLAQSGAIGDIDERHRPRRRVRRADEGPRGAE